PGRRGAAWRSRARAPLPRSRAAGGRHRACRAVDRDRRRPTHADVASGGRGPSMSVRYETPSGGSLRSAATEMTIVAAAAALAIVAALAAQFGVPRAQPLVGAVVILGIAYAFSTDRRADDLRTGG